MTERTAALPRSIITNSLLQRVLLLGLVFTALRAAAMLGPVAWRPLFFIHCLFMIVTPWLLLSREGRQETGILLMTGFASCASGPARYGQRLQPMQPLTPQ